MKTIFKTPIEWLLIALALLPLIFMAITWSSYPDQVPLHWGPDGKVDNMGSPVALWAFAAIGLVAYPLLYWLPQIDPKRKNQNVSGKGFGSFRLVLHLFFAALPIIAGLAALGILTDIPKVITIMLLLLFLGIGNYMTVVQPNYFAGIRTPWTLSNDEVWRKTHRLGGRMWVVMSLVMLPLVFFLPATQVMLLCVALLIITSIIVVVYSYSLWKKITRKDSQAQH